MTALCVSCQTAKLGFSRAALAVYPRNGNGEPYPIDSGFEFAKGDFDLVFWPDYVEPEPIYNYNLLTGKAAAGRWTHLVQWQENGQWTGILLADEDYLNDDYAFSSTSETPSI